MRVLIVCLMVVFVGSALGAVDIPDENLRAAIAAWLGKPLDAEITEEDMESLTWFEVGWSNISDLTGLEHATNLQFFYFQNNSVSDLSPLATLTNLEYLSGPGNEISNISALGDLTNLRVLELADNIGFSLSPLRKLTQLRTLHLPGTTVTNTSTLTLLKELDFLNLNDTGVSNLSVLSGLTKLRTLDLGSNGISSVSALRNLTNLKTLVLSRNNISNIQPLVDNDGLETGDKIQLQDNPLSDTSLNTHIPALRERGVRVKTGWTDTDVNQDGRTDIDDLMFVWAALQDPELWVDGGWVDADRVDVNKDGVVDIWDFVVVAQRMRAELPTFRAPSVPTGRDPNLSREMVSDWIREIEAVSDGSIEYERIIADLKSLLVSLEVATTPPESSQLLQNYPNPFNPETWIPYHLANDVDVQISIYDSNGALVRELDLGHQQAGYYTDRSRAAYWDGRNGFGEQIVSGIYFYQLRAGDYSATRRLVVVK